MFPDIPLADRMIFTYTTYCNGEKKTVNADPLVLYRAFHKALPGEDVNALFASASIDPDTLIESIQKSIIQGEIEPANLKLIEATRAAFRLTPPDEDGNVTSLTEDETLDLLNRFYGWMADQKKAPETSPSGLEPSPESPIPSTDSATPID